MSETPFPPQRWTQYNIGRRFLQRSPLHIYLAVKEPDKFKAYNAEYTLFIVMSALRQVISRERLYDENNTTIIICSTDLESAQTNGTLWGSNKTNRTAYTTSR